MNMISYWLFFISSVSWFCSYLLKQVQLLQGGLFILLWVHWAIQVLVYRYDTMVVSMAIFIASSLMGSLNYIVTVINLRTKGMSMTRLPSLIWAFFVTVLSGSFFSSIICSFAVDFLIKFWYFVFFLTSILLVRYYITKVVLRIVWAFILVLGHLRCTSYFALGITSEVIATNSRKPIFGYRAMIMSILAIAFLSTIVWGHHMFISGMNPFWFGLYLYNLINCIPSAVKAFNYITTLWKVIYSWIQLCCFQLVWFLPHYWGLTGIILGDSTLDINVHDTYFVVAHFHLVWVSLFMECLLESTTGSLKCLVEC
jgi:cytochrome c oxidase subunit 1